MYNRQLKITLYCSEEHFRWNFGRYLKNKKENTWPFPTSGCELVGNLNAEQIELWYTPRSFRSPYSLSMAQGSFKCHDEKVEIDLELSVEDRYPQAYLSIGIVVTIGLWVLFGLTLSEGIGFSGRRFGHSIDLGGLQMAMLIFVPLLLLILNLMAFNNSVKDLEKDILKYMSLIEKKPRKKRVVSRRGRHRR